MALTPVFSVFPHGVKRIQKVFYATFKMIVSPYEFYGNTQSETQVSLAEWEAFVVQVNKTTFKYEWTTGQLNFYVVPEGGPFPTQSVQGVNFHYDPDMDEEAGKVPGPISEASFNYGANAKQLPDPGKAYQMDFVGQMNKLAINPGTPTVPKTPRNGPIQFHDDLSDPAMANDMDIIQKNISDKLKTTKNYVINPSDKFNFKAIYATIMDEPYIAERHFGLMRELRVPITDMGADTSDNDVKISYGIAVHGNINGHTALPVNYTKDLYTLKRTGKLYYNGLSKLFFFSKDFKDIQITNHDLYKGTLENDASAAPHPDGIYINVTYLPDPKDANLIADPFQAEGIKGYNAAIRTNNFSKIFYSLSWHELTYTFPKSPYTYPAFKNSAMLNPRTEVIADQGNVRNNVLLTWRGDNLAVNRLIKDKQSGNGMTVRTWFRSANGCDNTFIKENLFIKAEDLLQTSQPQLLSGEDYHFVLRTVGHSEHCLPLRSELSPREREFTWTVDDELLTDAVLNANALTGKPVSWDLSSTQLLPIKKISIIGDKKYDDNNSGFVDNGNHMVLDQIENESSEVRYFYPPEIKFEDLKFLGYFRRESLRTVAEAQTTPPSVLTIDQCVQRAIRLEHRLKNQVPKLACCHTKINYLADPRGTQLVFFPADLATLNRLTLNGHEPLINVFPYDTQYPFYEHVRSLKLKVKRNSRKSRLRGGELQNTFSITLDDHVLYRKVTEGIYKFRIYITGNDFVAGRSDISDYNYTELQISILDKPIAPKTALAEIQAKRFTSQPNYWHHTFDLSESASWRSVKYTEETQLLSLDKKNPEDQYELFKRSKKITEEMMFNEFPYEFFLTTDGDYTQPANLRDAIYPALLNFYIRTGAQLPDGNFFLIRLNDKDTLTANILTAQLQLSLNGLLLATSAELTFNIAFNPASNHFELKLPQQPAIVIPNLINADISQNDVEVSADTLLYLQQNPAEAFIRVERSGKYTFIGNLQHSSSTQKKIRLFGSSPFQGYFPKATSEFDLGTEGSTHIIVIPNNASPEKPRADVDVLLMYTRDEYWNDRNSRHLKQQSTQSLIRLNLSKDFMKEGHNKLAILISADKPSGIITLIGEDITKLSSNDFSDYSFRDMVWNGEGVPDVFRKYLDEQPYQYYLIGDTTYLVLQCQPYYNTESAKWQVILPIRHFKGAETLFVKLYALKIAPGYGLKANVSQTVYTDTTGTSLSLFSDPIIFPIYNSRSFKVTRANDHYTINYDGPDVGNKLFFVMLTKKDSDLSVINPLDQPLNDLVAFDLWPTAASGSAKKVLLFTDNTINITRQEANSLVILEFEMHSNISNELKQYIAIAPCFVPKTPLFNTMPGIRLINIAEFIL